MTNILRQTIRALDIGLDKQHPKIRSAIIDLLKALEGDLTETDYEASYRLDAAADRVRQAGHDAEFVMPDQDEPLEDDLDFDDDVNDLVDEAKPAHDRVAPLDVPPAPATDRDVHAELVEAERQLRELGRLPRLTPPAGTLDLLDEDRKRRERIWHIVSVVVIAFAVGLLMRVCGVV